MRIRWTSKAFADLERLHAFLSAANPRAAAEVVRALSRAPEPLLQRPRLGARVEGYEPREVRRLIVGDYELRNELTADTVHVLRLWHSREDR